MWKFVEFDKNWLAPCFLHSFFFSPAAFFRLLQPFCNYLKNFFVCYACTVSSCLTADISPLRAVNFCVSAKVSKQKPTNNKQNKQHQLLQLWNIAVTN